MRNPDGFRVSVGGDPDYRDLTAEIYYKEEFLALISQDQGFDSLQLNIYANSGDGVWSFPMDELLGAIEYARQRLWDLRQINDSDEKIN
ncbi:hypothetical protein [Vibrio campbellii]|nr:hypothetical protein [Vibrio campbellii]MBT0121032.1 hypothetical protein [Vibrio campbellii]MBT0136104.1 hypothetical protein [Vibrio campbellii]MBT0140794.1 hypothetical protein [Vibrio campbellii]MBT0145489.1 hypothetical protein [Vibrio campbellii]MBT0150229.1 hypothetical protein [Vibrio campbellii]